MLNSLSVQNYALISSLSVKFSPGLSAITGETGAGKSILMGALGLVLGDRADLTVLNDKMRKCVVEAEFMIKDTSLKDFFAGEDIDYDDPCLIRRELLPSGKSRAFINDTPVTLPVLKSLGDRLVNIHAQHHNLMLKEDGFPLEVVDAFLALDVCRKEYNEIFHQYKNLQIRIIKLNDKLNAAKKEQDYLEFQFNQLEEARLVAGEEVELEKEQEILSHAEEIRLALGSIVKDLSEEETNALGILKKSSQELSTVRKYHHELEEPVNRLESVYIELKDLSQELERKLEKIDFNPERLDIVAGRLDMLYSLQRKHQVNSSEELIAVKEDISGKLDEISTSDTELNKLTKELDEVKNIIRERSGRLREQRLAGLTSLSEAVVANLRDIGMPYASFEVHHVDIEEYTEDGRDKFLFYFSANRNQPVELVQKVASGGEISRLMLSIKSLVSESLEVPTLIFDEIDAGVSGEIADKMGKMLSRISRHRQVINVTHLPQVAGRGEYHYQVYKYEDNNVTRTGIRLLDNDNRILEMAKMLSGEQLTQEALGNAKALLHKS